MDHAHDRISPDPPGRAEPIHTEEHAGKSFLRQNAVPAGILCFIILASAVRTGSRIAEVPLHYYQWATVFIHFLRDFAIVILSSAVLLWIIAKSKFIGWALLMIGALFWCYWLLPSPHSSDKVRQSSACGRKMQHIHEVIMQYCEQNDGKFPASLEQLVRLKLLDREALHCPGCLWHNPDEVDYLYYGAGLRQGEENPEDVLLRDKGKNHFRFSFDGLTFNGRPVRCVTIPPEQWKSFHRTENWRFLKTEKP